MAGTQPSTLRALLARMVLMLSAALHREDTERVAVWSVTKPQAGTFFLTMFILWGIALAYFAYDEMSGQTPTLHSAIMERMEAVMVRFGRVVIPLAATSMMVPVTITAVVTIADAARRGTVAITNRIYNRLAQPIEARGEARGEALGIQRALDWARRKADAEARGETFSEPPPEARSEP